MRYTAQHKAETRERLLKKGGAHAKKVGFAAAGVDALMGAAGLTAGAFYGHFRSKSDLLTSIVEHELSRTLKAFTTDSREDVERALARYLAPEHISHPELGCAVPTLGAEIARSDRRTKKVFERLMTDIRNRLQSHLPDGVDAWCLLSQMVGAVVIARAVASTGMRDEILAAVFADDRMKLGKFKVRLKPTKLS